MKDVPIPHWKDKRKFSKSEAIIDYIFNADEGISEREFAAKWGWSRYEFRSIKFEISTKFQPNFNHLKDLQSALNAIFSTKFQPKINHKQCKEKPITITTKLKNIFSERYTELFGESFYWEVKQTAAIKSIAKKLQFKMQSKGIEITDEQTEISFKVFLENINDKWILANYSPAIINSKFNDIITQIYASKRQSSESVAEEAIRLLNESRGK